MGNHFWLIQRGSFKDIKRAKKFLGASEDSLIDPDYMGSAEFEYGAIPKAYRRIMGKFDQYSLYITDLVTVRGVPFCLYCADNKYEQILSEIKVYLKEHYQLQEWTNMHEHFGEKVYNKYQLRTNFWWCIDRAVFDTDVGDWMAFIGAADRQNAFMRIIVNDYTGWWRSKSEKEREEELNSSL